MTGGTLLFANMVLLDSLYSMQGDVSHQSFDFSPACCRPMKHSKKLGTYLIGSFLNKRDFMSVNGCWAL